MFAERAKLKHSSLLQKLKNMGKLHNLCTEFAKKDRKSENWCKIQDCLCDFLQLPVMLRCIQRSRVSGTNLRTIELRGDCRADKVQ